ncbi:MAG TPA: NADPH-dependent F420 reductase [bacterium]|nr:NADPH-dependent F420 reductase [bacterium]
MRVAVIGGTGKEGFGLAARWARAGHHVIIGSRSADKAAEAASRAKALAPAGTVRGAANRDAASEAEVITLTIPFSGHEPILAEIRPAASGKPVIDTTVPLRRYAPPELEDVPAGSAAAGVQALLPDARVAAAMHSVSSVKLARFEEPLEGDVLYCGDDAAARRACAELIEALGMRPLDAGGLAAAGALESLAALIIGMNQRYKRRAIGIRFTGI